MPVIFAFFLLLLAAPLWAAEGCGLYNVRGDKVFYEDGGTAQPVPDADGRTFAPLFVLREKMEKDCIGASLFGKDRDRVFFRTEQVAGADTGSFKSLEGVYARDRRAVFLGKDMLASADSDSFVIKDAALLLAEDKKHVFCGTTALSKKELVSFPDGFIKDGRSVCRMGRTIPSLDAGSFTYYGRGYAQDVNGVYFAVNLPDNGEEPSWQALAVEDRTSFELLPLSEGMGEAACPYARDSVHVYFQEKIVARADRISFSCIPCPEGQDGKVCAHDAGGTYVGADLLPPPELPAGEAVPAVER